MTERTRCERCKEWERLGFSAHCPACDIVHFAVELASKQERLGPEFERVLYDNLPDLYQKTAMADDE